MSKRTFPISVVISFLTGRHLVCSEEGGLTAMYDFMYFFENYRPGVSMYSSVHSASLCEKLRKEFCNRYPGFAREIERYQLIITKFNWKYWLDRWKMELGTTLEVTAMTDEEVKFCYRS